MRSDHRLVSFVTLSRLMRHGLHGILASVWFVVILSIPVWGHAELPFEPLEFSDEQMEQLEKGEVIADLEQSEGLTTRVAGVVEAPPDVVWRAIDDYESQPEWVPDMADDTEVLRREGDTKICRSGYDMPFPIADRNYRLRVRNRTTSHDGETRYISSWSHVEGSGNIEHMEGFWIVEPFDDDERTLVQQVNQLDLGVSVPGALIRMGTRDKLPGIIESLRSHVETMSEE